MAWMWDVCFVGVERLHMIEFPTIFARRLLQLPEEVFCFWNDDFPAAYADEFFV